MLGRLFFISHKSQLVQNNIFNSSKRVKTSRLTILTGVSSLAFGLVAFADAGPGMDHGGFLFDEPIGVQFVYVASAVGQGNLVDFVRIHPDLALAAFEYIGGEALLQFQRN